MSGVLTRLAGRLRTGDLVTGISRLLALACLVGLVGMLPWLSGKDPALTILRATSSDREPTPEILDSIRKSIGIDGGLSRVRVLDVIRGIVLKDDGLRLPNLVGTRGHLVGEGVDAAVDAERQAIAAAGQLAVETDAVQRRSGRLKPDTTRLLKGLKALLARTSDGASRIVWSREGA